MTGSVLHGVAAFVTEQYEAELSAFRSAVDGVPENAFAATPHSGGHSVAWHALHIAEWTRLLLLGDTSATYAHLGWEDRQWVRELTGPAPVTEHSSKADVLDELGKVVELALGALRGTSDEDLDELLRTPYGDRPRLSVLSMQLRHTAYHRGQVKLTALQLNQGRL